MIQLDKGIFGYNGTNSTLVETSRVVETIFLSLDCNTVRFVFKGKPNAPLDMRAASWPSYILTIELFPHPVDPKRMMLNGEGRSGADGLSISSAV